MRTWHFSNFYFFYFATIGIIMPYWSVYLNHIGFSAKEIGQLMAIFLFTKMLAPNIWAAIADKVAQKHGSSLGLLKFVTFATVVVYGFMYVADGFWMVAAVMLGYCVFWNASLPQLEAATMNHLSDKRDYGRVRLWGSIGFIVTVTALGRVMDTTGPASILPAGGLALVALFVASLLMRAGSNDAEKANLAAVKPYSPYSVSLKKLLSPSVIVLLTLCLFMQLSHAPLQTFLSLYLTEYGYANWQIGLLWTTGVVGEIFVFIFAHQILVRFSLYGLLSFTFLVAALRWCLLAALPQLTVVVVFTQAMHAITFGLYHAVMIQMIDRLFVGQYQIRGQALYSSLTFGLGGALGSYASGYIWVDIGKQALFFYSAGMMLIIFFISLAFYRRFSYLGEV